MNCYNSVQKNLLELNSPDGKCLIKVEDIVYIRAANKCSYIYLTDNRRITVRCLLKDLEKLLSEEQFFRCHKSYIIYYKYVEYFCSNVIIMKGNNRISLSRIKKNIFFDKLKNYKKK
jgi:two-component system LytT family response regulator